MATTKNDNGIDQELLKQLLAIHRDASKFISVMKSDEIERVHPLERMSEGPEIVTDDVYSVIRARSYTFTEIFRGGYLEANEFVSLLKMAAVVDHLEELRHGKD